MSIIFRSLRARLLFYFLGFFFVIVIFVGYNLWMDLQENNIEQIDMGLAKVNLQILTISELERDFMENEIIKPDFYKSRYSTYLVERDSIVKHVIKDLNKLALAPAVIDQGMDKAIEGIKDELNSYEKIFEQMLHLIKKRGFREAGLEGELRRYIQAIEFSKYTNNLTKLLMARRYEKDFIIRKERIYATKVDSLTKEIESDIYSAAIQADKKTQLLNLLAKYRIAFLEFVGMEEKIGFDNQSGLRKDLNDSFAAIKKAIKQINQTMLQETNNIHTNIQRSNIIVLVVFILSFIVFSLTLTRILSHPVKKLSDSIHNIVSQDFSAKVPLVRIEQQDEVGRLSSDFSFMLGRMHEYINEIKAKSSNLEQKQRLLVDSIRYAEQIQRAILPDMEEIQSLFKDSFVIYQPADMVSGDFYWLNAIENKVFLAIVDCTGHGVPGAFMSMIGNTLLNKIVKENQSQNPSEILEELHIEVKIALHQEKHKNDDGMDIGLCMIEILPHTKEEVKIVYAGAKRPLWYFNQGTFSEIRGTKRSIGGQSKYHPFENHAFHLPHGSQLYLSTDGFNDQQDIQRKKFGKLRLMEIIKKNAQLPMAQQGKVYQQALDTHMQGNVKQRDDITLIGVQL